MVLNHFQNFSFIVFRMFVGKSFYCCIRNQFLSAFSTGEYGVSWCIAHIIQRFFYLLLYFDVGLEFPDSTLPLNLHIRMYEESEIVYIYCSNSNPEN